MTRKLFIIFIVLAVGLSAISFLFLKNTKITFSKNEHYIGTPVFKNINVNDVKTIKIIKLDSTIITLHEKHITFEKANSDSLKDKTIYKWTVKNLYDYPADTNKLSDLLQEIADLKVIQNVKRSPLAYKKLDLLSPNSAKKNRPVEIQFFNRNEKPLYALLIGKKRFETNFKNNSQIAVGRYVRIPSQKNIILTDELFNDINFKANDWLYDRDISINNIKKIELSKNSNIEWTLIRDTAEDKFSLEGTPEYTVLNKQKIGAITNSLNNLKFNSVADNKLSPAETGLDSPVTLTVLTFNGTKHKLQIGKISKNNRYIKCNFITADKGELTKKQLVQQNLFSKWVYLVNLNRIDPLLSSKDSILKQGKKKRVPANIYSRPIS